MAKIKLDSGLLERAKVAAAAAGYSSVEEFLTHLLEKELAHSETRGCRGRSKSPTACGPGVSRLMNVLAQIVAWLNVPANALGKWLLAPLAFMPGWLSSTLIAAVLGW